MLSINHYSPDYVAECRLRIAELISAYGEMASSAQRQSFEPLLFNHMVLALDNYFCHRARGVEGKDGNPLNEVRVLCNSLRDDDGILTADKTIKLDPAESILGYRVGERIELSEADFSRLSEAFFGEIGRRYS